MQPAHKLDNDVDIGVIENIIEVIRAHGLREVMPLLRGVAHEYLADDDRCAHTFGNLMLIQFEHPRCACPDCTSTE